MPAKLGSTDEVWQCEGCVLDSLSASASAGVSVSQMRASGPRSRSAISVSARRLAAWPSMVCSVRGGSGQMY